MMIVDVSGTVMTCHRRRAEGCRSAARLRSAAWCRRNRDRLRSRRGERAIAFAAIVGRLAGTSVTAIEQPLTESDVVGAGAIGEEAIVADTMEAVWQSVQQKAPDELIGIKCHHLGDAALLGSLSR